MRALLTYIVLLLLFFLCHFPDGHAQNLVPNGSFETHLRCPAINNWLNFLSNWTIPTLGTPDYFHACASPSDVLVVKTPANFAGVQTPRSGAGYAGFISSSKMGANNYAQYTEYLQVELDSALIAGESYYFEMYVSLAGRSSLASSGIGALFSDERVSSNDADPLIYRPQVVSNSLITDTNNWTKISGTYVAQGGERYLTIGRFYRTTTSNTIRRTVRELDYGYYYVDDVLLKHIYCDLPKTLLRPDTTICADAYAPIPLQALPSNATSFLWNTGNTSPYCVADTPGRYILMATQEYCSMADTVDIRFDKRPSITLGRDTALCLDKPFEIEASVAGSYLWNTGSDTRSISVTKAGLYWVGTHNRSCFARDSILVVQLQHPQSLLGQDRTLCPDSTLTLRATADTTILCRWSTSDTGPAIAATAPGTYAVLLTNTMGCFTADTITLDTFPSPRPDLGKDRSFCEGESTILDAGRFAAYKWINASVQRTMPVGDGGLYAVTVTDQNGCTASDTVRIIIHPKPRIELLKELRTCYPDTLITASSNAQQFLWNDGTSQAALRVTGYGKYTLTVTDTNTCMDSATLEVTNNCPPTLFVPNAFTPANDDLNGLFIPVTNNISKLTMQVYTRWGELIFETSSLHTGWDGTYRNLPALPDVYIYKIYYTDLQGKAGTTAGNVTLLR